MSHMSDLWLCFDVYRTAPTHVEASAYMSCIQDVLPCPVRLHTGEVSVLLEVYADTALIRRTGERVNRIVKRGALTELLTDELIPPSLQDAL